jgi:glycosyltransferase involved in cell wall biosynthesis
MTTRSVLLTTEGTYPFFEGGVSTWCDALIRHMPEVEFTLLSLTGQPGLRPAYNLPPNVAQLLPMPLWGTSGASELRRDVGWRKLHTMRRNIMSPLAHHAFTDAFDLLLTGLLAERGNLDMLGEGLRRLALFFKQHDYDAMFRHQLTWDLFRRHVERCTPALQAMQLHYADMSALTNGGNAQPAPAPQEELTPSLFDVAEALRLLYRWLIPITYPVPNVDLIHATTTGLCCLPGLVARLEHGTPLLITEHGVYLRERLLSWTHAQVSPFIKLFATRVTRRLVELSYATADTISPVSTWNARWEQRLGACPEKIVPIFNGVDPQRFTPQPMPNHETPTLVWVGRIDPLKDLLTLIEAAAYVRQAIPNVRLLLFGKTPPGNESYEATCRALQQELGLEETVQFMGYAKNPQDAYAQGHAVVLSSISEAQPFSVIEGMFCGRPVVSTGVGGVPEVIADTGRVVLPRNPRALADACIELLSNPALCVTLGHQAHAHALQYFTLQRSIDAYRSLYHQLSTVISINDTAEQGEQALLQERAVNEPLLGAA